MENTGQRQPSSQDNLAVIELFGRFGVELDPSTAARFVGVIDQMKNGKKPFPTIYFESTMEDDGVVCEFPEIPIASYCEHHLLPWVGFVYISYPVNGRVLGISKVRRLVEYFSDGLSLQEDVTKKLHVELVRVLNTPVKVEIKALHTCVIARGVKLEPSFRYVTRVEGK